MFKFRIYIVDFWEEWHKSIIIFLKIPITLSFKVKFLLFGRESFLNYLLLTLVGRSVTLFIWHFGELFSLMIHLQVCWISREKKFYVFLRKLHIFICVGFCAFNSLLLLRFRSLFLQIIIIHMFPVIWKNVLICIVSLVSVNAKKILCVIM